MTQLSGTVQQYVGRTSDLLAFDDASIRGDVLLAQALVKTGQGGALISGIEKLVQRFVIELFTEKGSVQYDQNRGTLFMTQLRAGMLRTSADLFAAFSSAEVDIRNNLRLEESLNNDPADERYTSATLLRATLNGDTANMQIQIVSAAGTDRTLLYPLRIAN